jgi:3D (Asp-Asp-Asp) domain-containing protein
MMKNFKKKVIGFWEKLSKMGSIAMVFVSLVVATEITAPKVTSADINLSVASIPNTILKTTNLVPSTIIKDGKLSICKINKTDYEVVKKVKMIITAYSSEPNQTDDTPFITASNKRVKDGIIANNLLPFGTKVRLPELYGDKIFTVEDRMHSRKGNYQADIWMESTKDAIHFGAKTTYIEVLDS